MRESCEIPAAEILPAAEALLARQGIGAGADPPARVRALCQEARALFGELARGRALWEEISAAEFGALFAGEGRNAPETPLGGIYPRATRLVLYLVTLGPAIGARITELFAGRDFALASMLDAAASEGAERLERRIEQRFDEGPRQRALCYSPGYCGWDISGQRALFARLRPGEIGVTLRESCLMEPLKSISGVIAVGPPRIHDFAPRHSFCGECRSRNCRERIARILEA
ncbi:MAG: hypothetical protein GF330_09745 [Candidatus Eisenbacteria bacterium]|nr:hypothetical protein [Candidatus Eisenbacteria bacterium]